MKKVIFGLMLGISSMAAWAKPQTVTLDLPTMNCAMCPITVKLALKNLEGVTEADVSYQNKRAQVSFEDTVVGVQALIKATTEAGYPSTVSAD